MSEATAAPAAETTTSAPAADVTTTTVTTTPDSGVREPSLRDELSQQFDEHEEDGKGELTEAARKLRAARVGKAATTEKPATPAADAAATVKTDAKADDKAKAADTKTDATAEAPTSWSAADRELFAKQTPEGKAFLLRRHNEMEKGFLTKTQELAGTRKLKESLDEIFQPYQQDMQLKGITIDTAIRQLVGAHAFLQKDPVAAIKHLAGQYGVDLKATIEGAAAADPAGESPTVVALRQQVQELTGQISKITGHQNEQQHNATLSTITQFADEKDAKGNLVRPYFEELSSDIAAQVRAHKAMGQEITLQAAYEKACYANATVRAKLLAANQAEQRAKDEAERKAKADAARKAGFDVKGEGAATAVAATTNSVRGDLEAAFSQHEGRV